MGRIEETIQRIFSENLMRLLDEKGATQSELAKFIGVSNTAINNYVKGYNMPRMDKVDDICRFFGVSRSELIEPNIDLSSIPDVILPVRMKKIPILGEIACGEPIFAEENYEGFFLLDKNLPEADFILTAKGDSMIEANIHSGDLVFLRVTQDVENGTIAAVLIEDDATLKRVNKSDGTLILQPCNNKYPPIIITEEDHKNVRILGEMVGVYSERNR